VLEVDIDKILPVTEARDSFNKIVDEVEGTDHMYVLTKNGKPAAVVVGVNHLEKLTGKTTGELTSIVEKKADETPVVEEVKTTNSAPEVPLAPQTEVSSEKPSVEPITTPPVVESSDNIAGQTLNTSANIAETPSEPDNSKTDDLFV
jgi:prevent-host-death family protein